MRIGELAALADVNIDTIRYYERRGLLEPPERLASGYRDIAVVAGGAAPAGNSCRIYADEKSGALSGTPSMRTIVGALLSRRSTCAP